MNGTSLDATAVASSQFVTQSVLDERHWQFFGFLGVPKRGRLFNAFRSRGVASREDALKQELPVASLAQIATWLTTASQFPHRELFLARIIEIAIDGLSQPVWSAYGFASRKDAILYFLNALLTYAAAPTEDHMKVFLERTKDRIPTETHAAWLVGVAHLYASPESMMPHIHPSMAQASSGCRYQNDVRLQDNNYMDIAKAALNRLNENEAK